MGSRGPKRLTTETLSRRGSRLAKGRKSAEANKQRFGEPPAGVLDPPPDELGEYGKKLWMEYAEDLKNEGLLTPNSIIGFTILCSAWENYWQAQELIAEQGLLIDGSRGQKKKNPAVQIREKALAQFTVLAGRFGIVPA